MLFKTIPKYKCNSNIHEILSYWYAIIYFTYLPNVGHYYNTLTTISVHKVFIYFEIIYLGEISDKQNCSVKEYELCKISQHITAKLLSRKVVSRIHKCLLCRA